MDPILGILTFLIAGVVCTLVIFGTCSTAVQVEEKVKVADRVWISHLPVDEKDLVQWFVMSSKAKAGAVVSSSDWRDYLDRFLWTTDDDESQIHLTFPQEDAEMSFAAKARVCDDLPPFDYCLELRQGQKTLMFYSIEDWTIDHIDQIDPKWMTSHEPCIHNGSEHGRPFFGSALEP